MSKYAMFIFGDWCKPLSLEEGVYLFDTQEQMEAFQANVLSRCPHNTTLKSLQDEFGPLSWFHVMKVHTP